MILYAAGGSLTAGSYVANEFCVASDDFKYVTMGAVPHPDNLKSSWSSIAAAMCGMALVNRSCPMARSSQQFVHISDFIDSMYGNAFAFAREHGKSGLFMVFELNPGIWPHHQKLSDLSVALNLIQVPHLVIHYRTPNVAKSCPHIDVSEYVYEYSNPRRDDHYQIGMMVSREINKILKERE